MKCFFSYYKNIWVECMHCRKTEKFSTLFLFYYTLFLKHKAKRFCCFFLFVFSSTFFLLKRHFSQISQRLSAFHPIYFSSPYLHVIFFFAFCEIFFKNKIANEINQEQKQTENWKFSISRCWHTLHFLYFFFVLFYFPPWIL